MTTGSSYRFVDCSKLLLIQFQCFNNALPILEDVGKFLKMNVRDFTTFEMMRNVRMNNHIQKGQSMIDPFVFIINL